MVNPKYSTQSYVHSQAIKLSCWNIGGYKSCILGNKFLDPDFLSEINNSDIVGISETHIYDEILNELDIAGFTRLEYKNRKKFKKANKSSGGLAIFAKTTIEKMFEPYKTQNKDIIWMKMKKKFHNHPHDIYLGSAYLSAENNTMSISEKIRNISEDIETIKGNGGEILLQGDLNARTSNSIDTTKHDKYDINIEVENFELPLRTSADKELNSKGKELLDLCKTYSLCIINGRKTGDILGNFTSFQPGGNGVVDYAIVSHGLFESILTFHVGGYKPWLSDHCPIHYSIDIGRVYEGGNDTKEHNSHPLPTLWYWEENCGGKFETYLKNEETSKRIEEITSYSDGDKMVKELNTLLISAAGACGVKKKKQKNTKNKMNPPWYDKHCIILKNHILQFSKLVQKHPLDTKVREDLYFHKRRYKNAIKQKKKKFKDDIIDELSCNRNNSRNFWKILNKLSEKSNENTFKKGISKTRWKTHFESLFATKIKTDIPVSPCESGCLDFEITSEELEKASYILRPMKATGIDGIPNEMILSLLKAKPKTILKIFNTILQSGKHIATWNTSIISPIHKKGSKTDTDNYRGIALACCMSKFFAAVLNQRLLKFALANGIISENQLGFMPGNRTSDALIILYNLFNQYCMTNGNYMYACFVDFKKAFDTIPRHILFQKLLSYKITGKFYNSIRNMYTQDLACICTDNSLTEPFKIDQGVKQGCILSPLLFNIFISDLSKSLDKGVNNPVNIGGLKTLNSIIWADDLLILSESENGMNNMLKNLEEYTKANLIQINLDKTKCMIFNKTGRLIRRNFWLGNERIEMVREYKYLGFLVTPSFNLNTALVDLRNRGLKAYGALKTKLGIFFRKHVDITIHLFNSLVKPILLYASDFWGCLKLPKSNPVENLHIKFCKDLLGVQITTTNLGVLIELGEIPLCIYGKKNAAKNWERISLKQKANPLLLTSTQNCIERDWVYAMKNSFSSIGLLDVFLNIPHTIRSPNVQLFKREKDIFQQTALHNIQNMSKLSSYSYLKHDAFCEKYLTMVQNVSDRNALTRFRLSNHTLMIERGRHQNILAHERFCPFCPNHIENEFHFLLKCPTYNNLRKNLYDQIKTITIGFYYHPDEQFFFWFLLSNYTIAHLTARYIRLAQDVRAFLLENHNI